MFLEGLSFLHCLCNVDTLIFWLRIRASRLSLTISQPAETVWKQQLQRFDLLSWVFQRCYSLTSYIFSPVSSFYHLVTKAVSVDGLWFPMFLKFVWYCKIGTFCELVCEHLFFLFQKKPCFSLSFFSIQNLFAPTRITYASVTDIKSMKIFDETPWTFSKRLLAFISPVYRSRNSQKSWNFLFLFDKKIITKKELLQSPSATLLNDW